MAPMMHCNKTLPGLMAATSLKLKLKRLREGTFALQAHDPDSLFKVRSLKVRRLHEPGRDK